MTGLADLLANYHMVTDGHDPENFRGCTHPDCVTARRLLKTEAALLAMLKTVTARLEAEIIDTYAYCTDAALNVIHPALIRRYNRDMQPVRESQALIAAIEADEVTT
jgi:hypothetical protein